MTYAYGDRTHYYTNNHDTIKRQIEEEDANYIDVRDSDYSAV